MSEPAYPHLSQKPDSYEAVQHGGLTKREWLAGMALQGLLAKHGEDDYSEDAISN